MHAVRKQTALAEARGLFRVASAVQVTWNILWVDVLQGLVRLGGHHSNSHGPVAGGTGVFGAPGTSAGTSRRSFFSSLPKVSQGDVFISHSWHGPAWWKLLTICHYLNLDYAILAFLCTCCAAACIVVLRAGSFIAVAEQPQGLLYCCLCLLPMLAFVMAYLGGHLFCKKSFWFDRLCIDQENLLLKHQSLQAMPAFVAHSTRMETYFERLWCIYELAVHSKAAGLEAAVDVIPTWLPLWTTFWIIICTAGGCLSLGSISPRMDTDSRLSLFVSVFNVRFGPVFMYPILGLIFSSFCFWKMKRHKSMLDQMARFDLRNAQCTLETDRLVIEEQVVALWDEALEPPLRIAFGTEEGSQDEEYLLPEINEDIRHITSYPTKEEIMEQFNMYVRGPLRDNVLESMGKEDQISFKLCLVATLPSLCLSVVFILSCDGRSDCEKSASYAGFSSVSQYTMTNLLFWVCFAPLGTIVDVPLMLSACHWVNQLKLISDSHHATSLSRLLGSCLCACVMYLADTCMFAQRGILTVTVAMYEPHWLAAAVACGIFDIWIVWYLFSRHPSHLRSQQSLLRS
eukprot:Skav214290  [mRNA]  locus=scaffold2257:228618:230602:+ [translate_table: standard]